jgi:hypothetical protein
MDKPYQTLIQHPLGENLPRADNYTEARCICAYNQTTGCVLGVEIACGDFTFANLAERMPKLTPQSGAGLWMDPFRGMPTTDVSVPLDLIYLDADYRVIEAVELFPTYRVSPSAPPAASVLALPTHTIFSSHTQAGDQVAFGLAEEIEHELDRLLSSGSSVRAAREKPARLTRRLKGRTESAAAVPEADAAAQQSAEETVEEMPWIKPDRKPKNWLQRWLNPDPPDPRAAPRAALPGLSAYFWTGGSPQPHDIRNVSSTGLYVVTDERWYPGTMVQMTLKKTGGYGATTEASITLLARANRWGNDGVGLSFVVRDLSKDRDGKVRQPDGIEREVLEQFLARIKPENAS